jgi:non-ribosomal peptide synthetase component F
MYQTAADTFGQQSSFSCAMEQSAQDSLLNRGVPDLVSAQAAATPRAIALTQGIRSLTYGELDGRANRVAHLLRSLGVGPDVVVGLYLDRSLAMAVGALAILKAGGAYLPLDPSYPTERLLSMWDDAMAPILVTGQCMVDALPLRAGHVVALSPDGQLGL